MEKTLIHEMAKIENGYWWFRQKHHFILSTIKKYCNKRDRILEILDVGCGTGETLISLKRLGNISGIDNDTDCIKYCKKKGIKNLYKKDLNKPFSLEKKYDVVIASDIIEHLDKPDVLIKSVSKILKKNGIFIITVPAHQFLYSSWDKMLHHKKRYSKKSMKSLIENHEGLKISMISYYNLISLMPALISRKLLPDKGEGKSEFIPIPKILNTVLVSIGRVDNFLALNLPVYLGLSVFVVLSNSSNGDQKK